MARDPEKCNIMDIPCTARYQSVYDNFYYCGRDNNCKVCPWLDEYQDEVRDGKQILLDFLNGLSTDERESVSTYLNDKYGDRKQIEYTGVLP